MERRHENRGSGNGQGRYPSLTLAPNLVLPADAHPLPPTCSRRYLSPGICRGFFLDLRGSLAGTFRKKQSLPALIASSRPARYIGQSLLLATAYFAAAKLSLLLAIPPGYATPVWP